jgi:ADP-heptose synthase, bifunctional sugar kinase/adenylyltransferase
LKVLVVGDTCSDVYLYGECKRMCPDAPVPVFVPTFERETKVWAGMFMKT